MNKENSDLLFFKIIPRHAIWGSDRIKRYFGYSVPYKTGQIWAFSAQKGGTTICQNGKYKGIGLDRLWLEHKELFDSNQSDFPFIISLVAPEENLSVQVHPTNKVAEELGFKHGKDEAWVLLNCDMDTKLIYGSDIPHKDLIDRIKNHKFKGLFREVSTKPGDFFYMPCGTIHSLGKHNIAYEIQQSTDCTLRLYDYDRKEDGKPRHLDVDDGIKSLNDAKDEYNSTFDYMRPKQKDLIKNENIIVHQYISNKSFTITKIVVHGKATLHKQGYWLTTVSQGNGKVNNTDIKFADNFIIPANQNDVSLEGNFTLMITSEKSVLSVSN